jgi:ABC-type sugar transport system ATPase subunit
VNSFLLEMNGISKTFGGVQALNNVSLNLYKGEILAVVGENGAGKSTLMRILSGSYPHNSFSGEIIVDGNGQKFISPSDAERAGIEMIYQEISMHLDMSIAENVFLGRLPSSRGLVSWKTIHEQAQTYTRMVGLEVSTKEIVRNLSTSQQQMVAIARALSRNPRILVLDEPTSALTEREVDILFEKLFMLKEKGISCIYITHKMKEVMHLADRITVLRDGKFVSTRKKEDTTITATVEDMVNRKISNLYPKKEIQIGEELFRVENLKVVHPQSSKKYIVEDLSFNVRSGEILGIVGLVGSGRSESVNAIFGGQKKAGGKVYIKGKEVNITNPKQAIKSGIALLTEDRKKDGFVGSMDVAQNSTLASLNQVSENSVIHQSKERNKAQEYIKKINIKVSDEKDNILSLSGGNQQKVVLSKWLMTKPNILFLDEPTRGIDVGAKEQIYEMMGDIAEEGKAIVFISSELPELVGMCDRFIVLQEGRICKELNRNEADEEILLKYACSQ